MRGIVIDCFQCKKDIETNLNWYEKNKQNVSCECGATYKVTSYKSGKIHVTRTDI